MSIQKFEEMNLSEPVMKAIADMGFESATQIQVDAIPLAMTRRDFIGQSQTGTGKTLAFAIPIVESLQEGNKDVQALVVCPTRELAVQVNNEIEKLLTYLPFKTTCIYGGESIERQLRDLRRGVQIVVGTPGRILDHVKRRSLKLETVKFVVLDEADEMLDMGFIEDIEEIVSHTSEDRQSMFFSATLPREIMKLSNRFLVDPTIIRVERKALTVDAIDQVYIRVRQMDKQELLMRLLIMEQSRKVIIFCNTKKNVDDLFATLQHKKMAVEALHGDMRQIKRDSVMKRFKSGRVQILIATDVAARGLDIKEVDMVVNYDLPQDEEQYVHRIGRTGRAGAHGKAYSFVFGREFSVLSRIESYTKSKLREEKIPNLEDVRKHLVMRYLEDIKSAVETENLDEYMTLVDSIKENFDVDVFLAAVLSRTLKIKTKETIDFNEYKKRERRQSSGGESYSRRGSQKNRKREKGMSRLNISVGRKHKIGVGDILGAVAGETGIKGSEIGAIDMYDQYSLLDVPQKYESRVLSKMQRARIKGNKLTIRKV